MSVGATLVVALMLAVALMLQPFIEKIKTHIQYTAQRSSFSRFFVTNIKAMTIKTFLLAATCGLLTHAHAQTGLKGEYFSGQNFEQHVHTRIDPQINFIWDNVPPMNGLDPHVFSIRWTGSIIAPETGIYRFSAHVDDGIRVYVAGKRVLDAWELHDSEQFSGEIQLNAGSQYALKVEYFNAMFEGEIQLRWQLPSEAPVFGGLLGYNDHAVESRYLIAPTEQENIKPKPAIVKPPVSKPVAPQKNTTKPTAEKPVKKVPAAIAADTLEKYIPKNILFVKSKSTMLPASTLELDNLAGYLMRNPNYSLLVEGHTDQVGNASKNQILSEERAQAVANYLSAKGIAAARVSAVGYGDTRPLVREPDGVLNPKNRRVAFLIQE